MNAPAVPGVEVDPLLIEQMRPRCDTRLEGRQCSATAAWIIRAESACSCPGGAEEITFHCTPHKDYWVAAAPHIKCLVCRTQIRSFTVDPL